MNHSAKTLAFLIMTVTLVAGQAERVFGQGRNSSQGFGGQFVRSLVSSQTSSSGKSAGGTQNRSQNRTSGQRSIGLTPGGLAFGGGKSSVAVSLAPGGVGVAVGTEDTAVAVAVGGGGVGVGVATESGTAVSVGAGGGGVAVGVVPGEPQYRVFGAPSNGGQPQNSTLQSSSPSKATGGFGQRSRSTSRFSGSSSHWNFSGR